MSEYRDGHKDGYDDGYRAGQAKTAEQAAEIVMSYYWSNGGVALPVLAKAILALKGQATHEY